MAQTELEATALAALEIDSRRTGRQCRRADREFDARCTRIIALLKPRIRRMALRWGMRFHWEDALQAGNIAVFKALGTYDPSLSSFSTHFEFRLRAEMKDLRFRMFRDERSDAVAVGAQTVSADATVGNGEATPSTLLSNIADPLSEIDVEAGASNRLASQMIEDLMSSYEARELGVFRSRMPRATPLQTAEFLTDLRVKRRAFELRVLHDEPYDVIEQETGLRRGRMRAVERSVRLALENIVRSDPRFAVAIGGALPTVEAPQVAAQQRQPKAVAMPTQRRRRLPAPIRPTPGGAASMAAATTGTGW